MMLMLDVGRVSNPRQHTQNQQRDSCSPGPHHYTFLTLPLLPSPAPSLFSRNAEQFLRLWRNEVLRVFHDRLICSEDKQLVCNRMTELVEQRFPTCAQHALVDPILFGDFRAAATSLLGEGESVRLYEDCGDYAAIKVVFEELLAMYNTKKKAMNLVFFEDALEHLTRIHRTIRLPQGNSLLVGVGGSGKQSLSRLAAYTAGCDVFEITLTRGYDEISFRDDLKKLYSMLGQDNKKVMFMFTDAHVADEGFLELINNMLTSGMVPALYDDGEKDGLINRCGFQKSWDVWGSACVLCWDCVCVWIALGCRSQWWGV